MKKIISILLAVILLSTVLVSCAPSDDDQGSGSGMSASAGDGNVPYDPAIDSLKYDGLELTFYYADIGGAPRMEFDAEEYSSDVISNVIYKRNMATEEKLGIDLVFEHTDGVEQVNTLRNRYMAQDPTYDIVAPYAYYGVGLTMEGVFENVKNLKYLNVNSSWWNQSYVDAITYQGDLYSLAGDLNSSITSYTMATFVNTDMMQKYQMGDIDLFNVVDSGEWTLEYMLNMCKDVYEERDNIDGRSADDQYGFIIGQISQPAEVLLVSFGFQWTTTDSKGDMKFVLNDHRNVDILSYLEDFYSSRENGIYKMEAPSGSDFATYGVGHYITLFSKGNTMVTMAPLFTAEKLVDTEMNYLLLPTPKYDVNQTEYRTACMDSHCNITVSSVSDSKDAAGAVLEYMGYLSEKDLTPQYFEVSYKYRFASDANTMKMFDMIVNSVHFDFARTYSKSLSDVTQKLRGLVKDSLAISSNITSYQRVCQGYLQILQKSMQKMGD